MSLKPLIIIALAGFISGCANTTHNVAIEPSLTLQTALLTNTHQINVTTDSLVAQKIGSIDTAINEHADIVISNQLEESVNIKVIQGLESLGFNLQQGKTPASHLGVSITQLVYQTETKGLKTVATMNFTLKANLKTANKNYKASYSSEIVDEFATLPSQTEIEKRLNEVAGKTVTRLLNDSNIRLLLQE
ncbi:YajG family lipoprotein [Marinomonas sp. MED121]|uniref:YajG family lipoprotein n=1 Tax=Marinomonas sp. MED121 TaxID=314277 RepID=UPI0002ECACD8|nr:YajG family lipoprotein [Marinomonas sp. MED121]